ncbi:hypothetical protein Q604_UNBC18177G0002, partial [human gut metagenome]
DKMAENKDLYPNVPPQVAPEKKQENSEKTSNSGGERRTAAPSR